MVLRRGSVVAGLCEAGGSPGDFVRLSAPRSTRDEKRCPVTPVQDAAVRAVDVGGSGVHEPATEVTDLGYNERGCLDGGGVCCGWPL